MINNESIFTRAAMLNGSFYALSIVDNNWKSANAQVLSLDKHDFAKSFEVAFNRELEDIEDASERRIELGNPQEIDGWIGWLEDEIWSFILQDCPIRNPGSRFQSTDDARQYILWQLMEQIRVATDDFKSKTIAICDSKSRLYCGKHVFVPIDGVYLVISLTERTRLD